MKTNAFSLVVCILACSFSVIGLSSVGWADDANGGVEASEEAVAKAALTAAAEAAREAEAAVEPFREALQAADTAFAQANREARAKRRQATESSNLAGERGEADLQRAETHLADTTQALAEARAALPAAEEALAEARAAALPLQQAYAVAEKAEQEAAVAARAAADAANQLDLAAERAAARAATLRNAAQVAAAALARVQQLEQHATARAHTAAQRVGDARAEKTAAETAWADAQREVAAATTAHQEAEQAARAAATEAPEVSETDEPQAAADAAALRAAAEEAQAALTRARQQEQQAAARVDAAAGQLTAAETQQAAADQALADAKAQVAAAVAAHRAAGEVAKTAEESAQSKQQAAEQAAGRRRAVELAAAALAEARESEQEDQVAAATEAHNAAREAAGELLELDQTAQQAAADAAAKRETAEQAREALTPVQRQLEDATIQAHDAARNVTRAEERQNAAETARESLQERIAAAKETYETDEQAAEQAEAEAARLSEEAAEARAAFRAATNTAAEQRALVQQAQAKLHRLAAAGKVPQVMESSEPPQPVNRIDEIVFARLESLGIRPSRCSDGVFVRRAYLDVTGKLPTAEKARAFIEDANPNKRAVLIDELLEQYAHADYWAMRWSDVLRIKAEFPVTVWPNAAQAYHRWVWESIAQNKPYDQFARELLTSSGSNYRVGPVNFYRALQETTPESIARAVALTFMGSRINSWPEEHQAGMATFFSQVGYKPTSEWKEEIVFWDPFNSVAVPGSIAPGVDNVAESVRVTNQVPRGLAEPFRPNEPLAAVFPDGTPITIPADRDPREVFADWLLQPENPWFARAVVNRIWAWSMGRGIIEEPDDIREDNLPSNPELLAYLEQELVSSGYDLRHLKRLIFTSATYQFSSVPASEAAEAAANFASYPMRRVEAEVLIDAVNQITGGTDLYTSAVPEPFTYIPSEMPAVALADGSVTSSFLTLFGRSARATGLQSERINELAPSHWLHMLNSTTIQQKLARGPQLAELLAAGGSREEMIERLYLTILSRFPTAADIQAVEDYAQSGAASGREMWIDLAWALINSPEFLLRH